MTKQTKTVLAVGAVALVGYFLWQKSQKPKYANFDIKDSCRCHTEVLDGVYLCGDGKSLAKKSNGACPTQASKPKQ